MPSATERLFFAIRPDASTALRIEALAQALRGQLRLEGKPLGLQRFHVTLHLIGDYSGGVPPHVVDAALAAARPVADSVSSFRISFDRVASFTRKARNMPLVLMGSDAGMAGLSMLRGPLFEALDAAGLAGRAGEAHFTPHLTLLYDDRRVAVQAIDAIGWTARELLLVRSMLGQSRHELLARLALRG